MSVSDDEVQGLETKIENWLKNNKEGAKMSSEKDDKDDDTNNNDDDDDDDTDGT